jgi:hypothetical protein
MANGYLQLHLSQCWFALFDVLAVAAGGASKAKAFTTVLHRTLLQDGFKSDSGTTTTPSKCDHSTHCQLHTCGSALE